MNKQILRMQKLAGLITEGQYRRLTENQASDLINDGVVLYASDDSKLAPGFIDPEGIGFIVYNVAIKDPSSSVISTTGTLAKNQKVAQIFNDNYGIIDINYIINFFTNANNWESITSEDELDSFTSKYNKIYLINHNGEINKLQESLYEAFDPFLDTEEGGYMREYIDSVAEEEGLDLSYKSDFDLAFNKALELLQDENIYPELNFNAIEVNRDLFWLGKY
jgi:hypothetical protein